MYFNSPQRKYLWLNLSLVNDGELDFLWLHSFSVLITLGHIVLAAVVLVNLV
jgi:hypothetical protein